MAIVAVVILGLLDAGQSQAQQQNVEIIGHLDTKENYKDVWGYDAPDGTALAIMGTQFGTMFINVTDPRAPFEIEFVVGPISGWRDIKSHDHYIYIVNDNASTQSLQIVDVEDPLNPTLVYASSEFFPRCHNIFIVDDLLFAVGAGTQSNPHMVILDVSTPAEPRQVGEFRGFYIHDIYVRDGVGYAAAFFQKSLVLLDVSDPANIQPLSTTRWDGAATHNTWLTDDGKYCLTTDETSGGHIRSFNVEDPQNVFEVAEWTHPDIPNASVHNVTVRNGVAFCSWYKAGLEILDLRDPNFIQRVGWYDTFPQTTASIFEGAWGVFPYTSSGLIYVSDIESGLYVLEYTPNHGTGRITVVDEETNSPIAGAAIRFANEELEVAADENGMFELLLQPGTQSVEVERFGFEVAHLTIEVTVDETSDFEVRLRQLPSGTVRGGVASLATGLPIEGVRVRVQGTPIEVVSNPAGEYSISALPAGSYSIEFERFGYRPKIDNELRVEADTEVSLSLGLLPALFADDMEFETGWTVGSAEDDASLGVWERGVPVATGLGRVQPGSDASFFGDRAFMTQIGDAGDGIGETDVDGGRTTLSSPVLDLAGVGNHVVLEYARWYYSSDSADPTTDVLSIDITSDGGQIWIPLERVTRNEESWTTVRIPLAAQILPTASVQLRFVAEDSGVNSIVEAGIDDVQLYAGDAGTELALVGSLRFGPNPVRDSALIRFTLAAASDVRVDVLDVGGRRVQRLVDGGLSAGPHVVRWEGRRDDGSRAAQGVYFIRLDGGGSQRSEKLLLIR